MPNHLNWFSHFIRQKKLLAHFRSYLSMYFYSSVSTFSNLLAFILSENSRLVVSFYPKKESSCSFWALSLNIFPLIHLNILIFVTFILSETSLCSKGASVRAIFSISRYSLKSLISTVHWLPRLTALRGYLDSRKWAEVRKCENVISHFLCPSKHRKRKMRKPLFLFSFFFYTTISSLPGCYS